MQHGSSVSQEGAPNRISCPRDKLCSRNKLVLSQTPDCVYVGSFLQSRRGRSWIRSAVGLHGSYRGENVSFLAHPTLGQIARIRLVKEPRRFRFLAAVQEDSPLQQQSFCPHSRSVGWGCAPSLSSHVR